MFRRDDIFQYPKERVSSGDTFRCRKCRTYLFSFDDLTSFHKKIEPVDQCSAWYLTCDDGVFDLPWVQTAIDESDWTEGKIYCPKCTARIGAFNITQGVKCSCYAYIVPAVWIQKSKVDQVTLTDMKPNIRLPRQYNEPQGDNSGNDNNPDSPDTRKTGQTESQNGSETGKTGSQNDQTGSESGKTRSQTSQSELEYCETESQNCQLGAYNNVDSWGNRQAGPCTMATGLESCKCGSHNLAAGLQSIKTRLPLYAIQIGSGNNQTGSNNMQSELDTIPAGTHDITFETKHIQSCSHAGQTNSITYQNKCGTSHFTLSKNCPQTGLTGLSHCGIHSTETSQTGSTGVNYEDSKPGPSGLCICNKNLNTKHLYCQDFSQECMVCHGCVLFHSLNNFHSEESLFSNNEDLNLVQLCSHSHNACCIGSACRLHVNENSYHTERDHGSSLCKRNKQTLRMRRTQRKIKEDDLDGHNGMDAAEGFDDSSSRGRSGHDVPKEETENIPEHLICPICLDLLYEPLLSPCDHIFCDSCLRILNSKCHKSVPRCPLCRKSLNYVYPAVDLRDEIRKTFSEFYRKRHRVERRAPHRRLPLPSGRLKSRLKTLDRAQEIAMPYSVLVFLVCVLAVCVLCLVILFVFCPPTSNHCITVIGYE